MMSETEFKELMNKQNSGNSLIHEFRFRQLGKKLSHSTADS